MAEIHEYDKNRWNGELSTLNEAYELLITTEVPQHLIEAIRKQIIELKEYLIYGANEEGTGPDNEWHYTNGEVLKSTHPEPGMMGISMYLCDICGCSLDAGETVRLDPHEGVIVCSTCDKQLAPADPME